MILLRIEQIKPPYYRFKSNQAYVKWCNGKRWCVKCKHTCYYGLNRNTFWCMHCLLANGVIEQTFTDMVLQQANTKLKAFELLL